MCFDRCVKSVIYIFLGFFLLGICCNEIVTNGTEPTASSQKPNEATSVLTPTPSDDKTIPAPPSSPATKPPLVTFKLEKEKYEFNLYSQQFGVIEQFKTEPKVDGVQYELEYDDKVKKQVGSLLELDSDSGVLRTKQTIAYGVYIFSIKAFYKQKDRTITTHVSKVYLTVMGGKAEFQYVFLKKQITENKVEVINEVENKVNNICEYSLANQSPSGDFFNLDKATGKLESNNQIDRESELFQGQAQAHIKMEIFIKCPSDTRKKRSIQIKDSLDISLQNFQNAGIISFSDYENPFKHLQARLIRGILSDQVGDFSNHDDTESSTTSSDKKKETSTLPPNTKEQHCYYSSKEKPPCDTMVDDKILYNTQAMKLLIIVDDANDNAPQFVDKDYFFGYPDKKLQSEILPNNVGNVQATDKDIGQNAAIKYNVKDVAEIILDPCTGTLHPHYAHFKYQKMTFEVTATDRDGGVDGLSSAVNVTVDILQGYHIMKLLAKRTLDQSNQDIIIKMGNYLKAGIKVLEIKTVPSLEEISESVDLDTKGYDILEYYIVYAHKDHVLLDMNKVKEQLKGDKELQSKILWASVLTCSPYNYVQSKSFVSTMVVMMLILCVGSFVFYMAYIRTGKYYKCLNYFKKTDSTTPLELDQGSIGTSDYVVSFARMHHVNPTFNIVETDTNKDFTPVTLKAYDTASTQIINVDELTPAPPILVNSNSNSRRNSMIGEDNGLSVGNESRARRKSTVSFNEIVEQYHTVHN